jgi:hypothetical protein
MIKFFCKHQKKKSKEKNARREGKGLQYFVSKFLKKKNVRPSLVSNPIFFSFLFYVE